MNRPYFDMKASGIRMKEVRKKRGISVKEVMEYMGFESTQAIYKWEAGKCYPQADNLIALAILYQVNPLELLVQEDQASSSFFCADSVPITLSKVVLNHWLLYKIKTILYTQLITSYSRDTYSNDILSGY